MDEGVCIMRYGVRAISLFEEATAKGVVAGRQNLLLTWPHHFKMQKPMIWTLCVLSRGM